MNAGQLPSGRGNKISMGVRLKKGNQNEGGGGECTRWARFATMGDHAWRMFVPSYEHFEGLCRSCSRCGPMSRTIGTMTCILINSWRRDCWIPRGVRSYETAETYSWKTEGRNFSTFRRIIAFLGLMDSVFLEWRWFGAFASWRKIEVWIFIICDAKALECGYMGVLVVGSLELRWYIC